MKPIAMGLGRKDCGTGNNDKVEVRLKHAHLDF
jgi:hypothetical protein